MDLPFVNAVVRPNERRALPQPRAGDAFLAGGTWLFSDPQPDLRRLIDLRGFGWTPIQREGDILRVASTCTLTELERFPWSDGWPARRVISPCCRALLGSFKIRDQATVGGNLCLALPAGPIACLGVALDATCIVWSPDGSTRHVPCIDFVIGPSRNALRPGELLSELVFAVGSLRRRAAIRRASLTNFGRSAALLIGTIDDTGLSLTVTAATTRPHRFAFPPNPDPQAVQSRLLEEIDDWHDDVHGAPDWRAHMTQRLAAEIVGELAA